MTQIEAVRAYGALRNINSQRTSGKVAKNVFTLMNKLKPIFDFQIQEEEKIYAKYPNYDPETQEFKIDSENGMTKDDAVKKLKELENELKELAEMEVTVDNEKFQINLDFEHLSISGEDIGNLEPFIEFI